MSAPPSPSPTAEVFALLGDEYEQVLFGHDEATGLRCIIALHSTVLGPSLGGTRFLPYASTTEALVDVLRLSRGMTYKHAAAGLDAGGGKAVIIGSPAELRTDALIEAYARQIHSLGGRYLTAEDVGTTQVDMDLLRSFTPYVTGTSHELGGSDDPSPATAWGVRWAMLAAAERAWDAPSLADRRVAVSGVGKVGSALVGHLVDDGVAVVIADVNPVAVQRVLDAHPDAGIEVADPAEVHTAACDVFAPCALGAVLSEATIPFVQAEVVCGAANNQLATPDDGRRVADRGITYVPDYVANAGGVINIAEERHPDGYDHDRAWKAVERIHETVGRVLDRAATEGITPAEAADRTAEDRLAAAQTPA
jgi:valine dehydrogenase (NAD+)